MKLDGGGGIKFEILNKKKCKRIVPKQIIQGLGSENTGVGLSVVKDSIE